jgi:hypothetical protein
MRLCHRVRSHKETDKSPPPTYECRSAVINEQEVLIANVFKDSPLANWFRADYRPSVNYYLIKRHTRPS